MPGSYVSSASFGSGGVPGGSSAAARATVSTATRTITSRMLSLPRRSPQALEELEHARLARAARPRFLGPAKGVVPPAEAGERFREQVGAGHLVGPGPGRALERLERL